MNIFKKTTLALVLSTAMISGVLAEQSVHIITVKEDGSVGVKLSGVPTSDMALLYAIDPNKLPKGDLVLVLEHGERPRFTTKSLKDAYNEVGGKGSPEIDLLYEPEDTDPKKIEIVDLSKGGSSELNFPIAPMDGVWETTMSGDKIKGCPAQIVAQFASRMNEHTTENITFSQPFHPTDLKAGYKQLTWQKKGVNAWAANPLDMRPGKKNRGAKYVILCGDQLGGCV